MTSLPLWQLCQALKEASVLTIQLPTGLADNLRHPLREYQKKALAYLNYYYEHKEQPNTSHVLFHMATGSGKTLVMAGAMLYFYAKGYRRFLFCSHRDTIVAKTRDNLTNHTSAKYLFKDQLHIDGQLVRIQEVISFSRGAGSGSLDVVITTIQALHEALQKPKENSPFTKPTEGIPSAPGEKMVILADEAHHFQVKTKSKKEKEEADWESSLKYLLDLHKDNYLLEFTATMPDMKKYKDKELCRYSFKRYREDGYSKEVYCLVSEESVKDRILQALVLSQYRQAVASQSGVALKPVILFKAMNKKPAKTLLDAVSAEDKCASAEGAFDYFVGPFWDDISDTDLIRLKTHWEAASSKANSENLFMGSMLKKAFKHFEKNGGWEHLIQVLKRDFDKAHCRCIHSDKKDKAPTTLELNNLEDRANNIRAIFAVEMLNEGWDVLNLFDIVRLYASKGSGNKNATQEAQLIGRGARYCPFRFVKPGELEEAESKYKRKFDQDVRHPLRACELLYYHCKEESKFIRELNHALEKEGIKEAGTEQKTLCLTNAFKKSDLYQKGTFRLNKWTHCRHDIPKALDKMRPYTYRRIRKQEGKLAEIKPSSSPYKLLSVKALGYAVVRTAIQRTSGFHYAYLRQRYTDEQAPKSMHEFIRDVLFKQNIRLENCTTKEAQQLTQAEKLTIARGLVAKVKKTIDTKAQQKKGTRFEKERSVQDIFKDKHPLRTPKESFPIPKEHKAVFGYKKLYLTDLEEDFIGLFIGDLLDKMKDAHYHDIHLLRSERFFKLYAFENGGAFEPDFVLFAKKNNSETLCLQCFIEPKGEHLANQKWKEDFLTDIEKEGQPSQQSTSPTPIKVLGLPFYTENESKFIEAFCAALNLKP